MNRLGRAKVWTKKHQEDLVVGGIGVTMLVGALTVIVLAVRADLRNAERRAAELNAVIDDLNEWYAVERKINKALMADNVEIAEKAVELAEELAKKTAA